MFIGRARVAKPVPPLLESKFGPFASWEEAESWRRQDGEAPGDEGYEYSYRIEPVPTAIFFSKQSTTG